MHIGCHLEVLNRLTTACSFPLVRIWITLRTKTWKSLSNPHVPKAEQEDSVRKLLFRPPGSQLCIALLIAVLSASFAAGSPTDLPDEIRSIMEKPRYSEAIWALRV